jgi:hypothetical protein
MSEARPAEGTDFQMKIASVFTSIGGVVEIDGFSVKAEAVPITVLKDVLVRRRKSRQPDPGTLSLKLNVDPNDPIHQSIYEKTITSTPDPDDEFKMIFVDDETTPAFATFLGFFTEYKLTNFKGTENAMAECELQLNSLPAFTEGVTP